MVFSFWASLGRGPAMCEVVWLASAGGNSARGLHSGAGGGGPGFSGVCAGGVCGPLGELGVPRGVGLPVVGVCGLPGVGGGEGCSAGGSVAGVCCCLGGWGRPVSRGPRCVRLWACVGLRVGSGGAGAWAGIARGAVLCGCMRPLAAACLCGQL